MRVHEGAERVGEIIPRKIGVVGRLPVHQRTLPGSSARALPLLSAQEQLGLSTSCSIDKGDLTEFPSEPFGIIASGPENQQT
jgi:hypothetical protein